MSIIFRYSHIPRLDGVLKHAPFIPIQLRTKFGQTIEQLALLDSGADNTVIPKELAELLGLKESSQEEPTGGIGGSTNVRKSSITLVISGDRERYSMTLPSHTEQRFRRPFLVRQTWFLREIPYNFQAE